MDFFEHQERAEKRTLVLFLLFSCAVVAIVGAVYVAVTMGLFVEQFFQSREQWLSVTTFWNEKRFLWVTLITVCVIAAGSIYKTQQLRKGGGSAVAEMLGGERLPASVKDLLHRRMLNVVEEMAIASGLPVPPVYILNQTGINAFAAGFAPSDMVIGITNGAIELLSRDELQGVIAHEFSHILHGDTRINMRMMSLLCGITLISDIGMILLTSRRSTHYSSRKRGVHPGLLVLGLLLFFVGLIGTVIADLIKRAISRQREFLADASAVQFTRNPQGIANALKVIGGYLPGSRVEHVGAEPFGHFFFGYALRARSRHESVKTDWWATHPPLLERIQRIEPRFRGQLETVNIADKSKRVLTEVSMGFVSSVDVEARLMSTVDVRYADAWLASIGGLQVENLAQAAQKLADMPPRLREFAYDPYTARAVCYAMLLSKDSELKRTQLTLLEKSADSNVFREMLDILSEVEGLSASLKLPLLDIMLPALKSLSQPQYQQFVKNVRLLSKADHQISLFEYALYRMLLRRLRPAFSTVTVLKEKYRKLKDVDTDCGCVLAVLIRYGVHGELSEELFGKVTVELLGVAMPWPPARVCHLSRLDRALAKLEQASPQIKKALLTACVQVVFADGQVHVNEAEALRAIADGMDCPIPPIC